jgi:lysophospholipase L1-like esterase
MTPVWYQAVIASVFILLSGCGGGSSGGQSNTAQAANTTPAAPPPITSPTSVALPATLIIVGDSIMAGCIKSATNDHPDYALTTAHLVAQQGIRVVNLSRSGNSMNLADTQRVDGGINFTQSILGGTAIWITLGFNGFYFLLSTLEEYKDRYLRLLSRIEPIAGQKVFCASPLLSGPDIDHKTNSTGAKLEDYRQVIRDIASQGHCTLAETSEWFDAEDIYDECQMPDTVHLGEDGHIKYTAKLLETIRGEY